MNKNPYFSSEVDWVAVVANYFQSDYRDRGKVKWNGFFLSDHTAELKKQKHSREQAENQSFKAAMPYPAIQKVVGLAYQHQQSVVLQRSSFDLEKAVSPLQRGKITGFFSEGFYLNGDAQLWEDIQFVEVDHERR